jgi:hypothetical protein
MNMKQLSTSIRDLFDKTNMYKAEPGGCVFSNKLKMACHEI